MASPSFAVPRIVVEITFMYLISFISDQPIFILVVLHVLYPDIIKTSIKSTIPIYTVLQYCVIMHTSDSLAVFRLY